jgi:hypothetical protein
MRLLRAIPAVAIAAALLVPSGASAAAAKKGQLWATVNICDVSKSPNRMGVRAQMPGDGRRERMYMHFTAQYRSGNTWKQVGGKSVSRWLYAGSALFQSEQLGFTFSFDPPSAGTSYLMRGRVDFQWKARHRKNGRVVWTVVHSAYKYTAAGHPTSQAEPAGFSAADCRIGS